MDNPFTNISTKPFEGKDIDAFGQLQFENLERLSAGRGDNSMNFDADGLWIGNQYFSQAPFTVDLDGNLVASNALITGQIIAGTGSEVDWSYIQNIVVENAHIESLAAEKITSQIVDAQIANIDFAKIDNVKIGDAHIDGKLSVGATDADVTADNPQNVAWLTDSGDMAYEDLVEKAKLGETVIVGGYLRTDMLDTEVAYISDKAMIANATIDEAHIDSLSADDISTGTLKGIDVISTDGGSDRIELSSGDQLKFYAGGIHRAYLRGTTYGSGGLFLGQSSDLYMENDHSLYFQDSGGTDTGWGGIKMSSSNHLELVTGTSDQFYVYENDATTRLLTATSTRGWFRGYLLRDDGEDIRDSNANAVIRNRGDTGRWTIRGDIHPFFDNDFDLGSSGVRWANVYTEEIHTGDIGFANNWTLTESYNVGIKEKGLALVDEKGEMRYFFGKRKFYTPQDVKNLEYKKLKIKKKSKKKTEEKKV